jgi:hypothetical protein
MRLHRTVFVRRALAMAIVSGLLGGCMSSTPIWDAHFGESVKTIREAQIIDPHAAEHNPSTQGVDGEAAVSAMAAYNKSFTTPTPSANPFVIGIGTDSGSNGGH